MMVIEEREKPEYPERNLPYYIIIINGPKRAIRILKLNL